MTTTTPPTFSVDLTIHEYTTIYLALQDRAERLRQIGGEVASMADAADELRSRLYTECIASGVAIR